MLFLCYSELDMSHGIYQLYFKREEVNFYEYFANTKRKKEIDENLKR